MSADHSHSFVHYGNVKRGNPIFGFQSDLPDDGKPALSLSYGDGSVGLSGNQVRANLTGANYNDKHFKQQALVKRYYESHSAEDVGRLNCRNCCGVASPQIWTCYLNFGSLSLFMSLEICCFYSK